MSINGTNVVVTGGTFNINDPRTATECIILRTFGNNYVPSATHDNNDILDPPKCHPGTRVSLLTHLSNWVEDTKSTVYITWLHGPAGAGKSAIARSLAEILHRKSLLAGSFFFFRTDSRRNSEKPLVTTLAYQISRSIPDTQPYIAKAVQDDPTVISMSLETQFTKLIMEPLLRITANDSILLRQMVIIIDGLDECLQRHARQWILRVIFEAHRFLHSHVKFFVVSRPEYDIQRSFDSVAATLGQCVYTIRLQEDLQAYEDVRKYLRYHFHQVKETHPLRDHFPLSWPSENAIEQLVKKSSGHFIYASTVIKFIEHDFDQPQERLDIILNLRATSQNPYAALDALYLNILTSARAGHALLINILKIVVLDVQVNHMDHRDQGTMKSVCFIESVLFLQPGAVRLALLDLKSLVGVNDTIEFWHKSFSDFLLDPSRSNEFYTPSVSAYTLIAKSCLKLLSDKTGLLERLWSGITRSYPTATLKCHHLLSLCCERGFVDLELQNAMMQYEFNVIPPDLNMSNMHFWTFCCCLRNYQRASMFRGTNVVERLHHKFDHYLISELRRVVPLDSEIMNTLHAIISPVCIDWYAFERLAPENTSQMVQGSCFLRYMCRHRSLDGDHILCDFFYSKARAGEYYLGESPPKPPSEMEIIIEGDPSMTRSKKRRLH